MKRNQASALFAHLKKEKRDSIEADDEKHSAPRRESGGKHGASPSVPKSKVVPPGQKSITAFFMKPNQEREDAKADDTDVGECTTVLSEKRRRLDSEEDQGDLPATFSQWDRAWDEGTSGLEWNKTPGSKGESRTPESAEGKRDQHRASTEHEDETSEHAAEMPERKSLLLHLDDDEKETKAKKIDVNDWLNGSSSKVGKSNSSEKIARSPATDQPPAKAEQKGVDGDVARAQTAEMPERKRSLLLLDDDEAETSREKSPGKDLPALPKYVTDRSPNHKVQSKLFGAFSAPVKQRPAEERRRDEIFKQGDKAREENPSKQQAEADALRDAEGKLPAAYQDAWDDYHVRLPCSPRNVSIESRSSRWDTVRRALWPPSKLESFSSLRKAILAYMSGASAVRRGDTSGGACKWEFLNLRRVLEEDMGADERKTFFWSTLPHMVRLALALPTVCSEPIPLLRAGASKSVDLSALQAASLLANAFFCTFPAAAAREQRGKFPYINFQNLFESEKGADQGPKRFEKRAKLRCMLHYFDRQARRLDGDDAGSYGSKLRGRRISFSRRVLRENAKWEESSAGFEGVRLRVHPSGTIEDHDRSGRTWQADFANCMIGGGVLGKGAVQEEIRFIISPELIVSRLLTEELGPKESVLIVGTERFCNYSGYASSFRFAGDHVDEARLDASGRLETAVTAMDAIFFYRNEYLHQFRDECLRRELNKALVSFCPERDPCLRRDPDSADTDRTTTDRTSGSADSGQVELGPMATGNWGCGVFGGDPFLKAVIQIMAAAEAGRSLEYLTFGDQKLSLQLEELFRVLVSTRRSVREVFAALSDFRPHPDSKAPAGAGQDLRRFLLERFERGEDAERDERDERENTP